MRIQSVPERVQYVVPFLHRIASLLIPNIHKNFLFEASDLIFHDEQFISLKQPRHFFDTRYDRLISVQCTQLLSAESLNVFRPRSIAVKIDVAVSLFDVLCYLHPVINFLMLLGIFFEQIKTPLVILSDYNNRTRVLISPVDARKMLLKLTRLFSNSSELI